MHTSMEPERYINHIWQHLAWQGFSHMVSREFTDWKSFHFEGGGAVFVVDLKTATTGI